MDIFGDMVTFKDGKDTEFESFDLRNMFMCIFLNLRGSLFQDFETSGLTSLVYIDIR